MWVKRELTDREKLLLGERVPGDKWDVFFHPALPENSTGTQTLVEIHRFIVPRKIIAALKTQGRAGAFYLLQRHFSYGYS